MAKKVFLVGLCGQSASGKTTILETLNGQDISGRKIHILPNCINSVCADPNRRIISPDEVIERFDEEPGSVNDLYDEFLADQAYLQSQVATIYETMVYDLKKEDDPSILLTDRTLIDFYLYTNSGINYISRLIRFESKNADNELKKMQVVTSNMMKALFDLSIIIYPHGKEIVCECEGRRKTGLEQEYTGSNWYSPIFDIDYSKHIEVTDSELDKRCKKIKQSISRYL